MPLRSKELSPIELKRLVEPGRYAVGGVAGLYLVVKPTGAKSWVFRYALPITRTSSTGRPFAARRDAGLGAYPDVTLAQAREKARALREQIASGVDPVQARREARAARAAAEAKALTFDEAARKLLAAKTREFRNPKHALQWSATLNAYASPVLGALPVDAIELAHVVEALSRDDLWTTKPETASRVRGRIEAVLNWATASGHRSGDNPARWRGNLDAVLPKPTRLKRVRHHKALPIPEMHDFMMALRQREGMAARALEFLILTAARSGEVRGATWAEIDLQARTWTIPADRMKAGREHVVPLCDDAIRLLKALPQHEGCDLVFASPRLGQLSDMSISAVLRRMKVDAVPHGFRSTFRDWCSEFTSYPHEVAEMALAHTIPNAVERAYRRGDLLTKRRRLMEDWAKLLNAPHGAAEVLPIRREGGAKI
ncbi:Integrase [Thioalkalivibrio nitratireducens DSM 14787]|uniref:Integrase n=1 Tax=Thioalkalivibrio nitratireducens (strain DSM 14787 / UNIQEM 213 / ALEN2) TaxID=1255043 RepID=L0DXN3_THIND|nr:site-specific integrase [Thioalkalivibrio nitratireducens]AGA33767.1 Integrase [Thioalkalivibrio nitratireducens DSM 14787]